MSLTAQQTQAIFQLYPTVVVVRGDVAYDADNNEVSDNIATIDDQTAKNNCKAQATAILTSTDWTSIPDVGSSTASNPYLVNQSAFIAYRSQIRALAVNPVVNPMWPTQPIEQWSN